MIRKVSTIFTLVACLIISGTSLSAFSVLQSPVIQVPSDSSTVIGVTDSLAAALQSAFTDTTTAKVRDRGYDASKYKMLKRYQPKDHHEFQTEDFFDKTFYSIRAASLKLGSEDYPFGLVAGFSMGKWLHEDHALRLNLSGGHWYDNFNGYDIHSGEVSMSYMFNVISYLSGYDPARFCNLSVVAGGGYALAGYKGNWGHSFAAHVGFNIDMRLSPVVDFFVEPLAKLYSNGMAISRAGNWRSWLSAFEGSIGMTFNVGTPKTEKVDRRWFMSIVGGTQVQNSVNVYEKIGIKNAFGLHANIGVGHYVTDYLAIRGSLSFSRHKWVEYDELYLYSSYYALRVEGMLDLVNAFSKTDNHGISLSLLFGPELGYMYKDDYGVEYLAAPYIGLTGGVQLKFDLGKKVRIFMEPRCSIVPYNGISYDRTTLNDYVNYYDGLINLNLGLEFDL